MKKEVEQILQSFVNWNNAKISEYEKLALKQDYSHLVTNYSARLLRNCNLFNADRILSRSIKGSPLIDVGCGTYNSPAVGIAIYKSAKIYLGVDIAIKDRVNLDPPMPRVWVKEDILLFLAIVNTNSANFCLNGIDFLGGKYLDAVISELERATKAGGVIFGVGSEPIQWELRANKKFTTIDVQAIQEVLFDKALAKNPNAKSDLADHDFFLFVKKN